MIIDKILDRYDGDAYDPEDFYRVMMSYEEGTDFPISRALDSGEEEDIKRELCAYIDDGNYNPKIKDFINSVKWLEADDGKDYSKEFDILGESKFKCSMAKKKESLAKKSEGFKTDWQMDVVNSLETIKDKYGLVVEYKEIEDGLNGVTDSYTVKIKRGPLSEIMAIVGPDYLNLFTEDVSRQYLSKDYDSTEVLNKLVDAISEYVKKNDWTRESKKGESKFKCSMAKKKESLGKKNEEAVPFNATEFPKELKQMYNACSKEFYCESELSSAVDVSSGKDGVSSAHYVLRGEYGSYAKLKVVFDYDKEDGFTITILGLDETVGYDWVELGSGKSSSFKEALTTALNEFGKNIMSLVSKIRKATGKSESKKNESVYGTVRVDSEDIAIKVQESNVYPSSSGRSLSGDVPKVESWFSTLSEFSDCIDGMAEDCNGYPDISRDGSDILVKINAPMEDENGEFNGDYEVIVELRCSTEITNGSLDGVVDLLNHE